jgi:hypothetical protein
LAFIREIYKEIYEEIWKFFALKLKVPKNSFGTATLKPYRAVNTHPKETINSSF